MELKIRGFSFNAKAVSAMSEKDFVASHKHVVKRLPDGMTLRDVYKRISGRIATKPAD